MDYAPPKLQSTLRPLCALAIVLLATGACAERERAGSQPSEPMQPPSLSEVAGSYSATRLIVEREGSFRDLVGEPDTRLDIQLNLDGTVHGQLKIGTDPQLRSKAALVGSWRLRVPNGVTFEFNPPNFLDEIYFTIISYDRLTGDWVGEDVVVRVELQRIG